MDSLVAELKRGKVLDSGSMSRSLVAMNALGSIIDMDTSEKLKFTLVLPEDADADHNKI